MKSRQKKTPVKKPRQQPKPNMPVESSTSIDSLTVSDTMTIDLGNYTGTSSSYTLGSCISSITLPSTYSTSASTITYSGTNYSWSDPAVNITSDGITMKEGSDIKVGNKSLLETITAIEERLGILKPNPELEDRWEQLKELRRQYMELEKDLLEKEKIMKILKEK